MSVTPNMGLVAPGVGSTPGPDYALQINSDFTTIDQHDHTPGKGILIPVSGLNINDNLSLNNHKLTDVLNLNFTDQASNSGINDYYSLYTVNGNLYFNDTLLNKIQITKNGAVNATLTKLENVVGPDTYGAAFSNNVLVVSQTAGILTGRKQPIAVSEVQLSGTSTLYQLTLLSPTLLGSYSITLPSVSPDAAGSLVSISTSGVMSPMSYNTAAGLIGQPGADLIAKQFSNNTTPPPPSGNGYLGLTAIANNMSSNNAAILMAKINSADSPGKETAADNIAAAMSSTGVSSIASAMTAANANTIVNKVTSVSSSASNTIAENRTRPLIQTGTGTAAGQIVTTPAVGYQNTQSTNFITITQNSVQQLSIVTSGRPIMLILREGTTNNSMAGIGCHDSTGYGGAAQYRIIRTDSSFNYIETINTFTVQAYGTSITVPPTVVNSMDFRAAGTYYYAVQFRVVNQNGSVYADAYNVRFTAYEL